jgi:hypothetical protein
MEKPTMLTIELDMDVFEALREHLETLEPRPPLLDLLRAQVNDIYDEESEKYWLGVWSNG